MDKEAKKIIYCIPGLGQDKRIFSRLQIGNAELRFIDWFEAKEEDDIPSYAAKIAKKITADDAEEVYLLGVSLGGVMCVEIAELIKVKKIILISTVKNRKELPPSFEWMGRFPIKKNSFPKFLIDAQIFFKPFLGKTDEEGMTLFQDMLRSSDLNFIRWAWNHIPNWRYNKKIKAQFIHLHGTNDLVFPIKHIDQAVTLKGATHYAIYDEAKKLNRLIELFL